MSGPADPERSPLPDPSAAAPPPLAAPAPPSTPAVLRETAAATALLALLLAAFFAPALSSGTAFLRRDNGRMHLAVKRLVAEALARGELPQWNPWGGLGYPLVGGGVDAILHPFNALLVLLPLEVGFKAWTLLSLLLAATGAFAWARQLGVGFAAAVTGAVALSLSGFLVSSTDNLTYLTGLGALPLLLAAAHAWLARGGGWRLLALGLASYFAATAGDPQSWAIAAGALPFYAALLVDRPDLTRARLALRGAGATGAAAIAAAPALLPMLAWLPHSSRGDPLVWIEHLRYNLLPVRALELGLPGLFRSEPLANLSDLLAAYSPDLYTPVPWVASEYLGVTVLAFAVHAAVRSRRAAVLVGAAVLFAWMAMGSHAGFGAIARHLPIVKGFRYWEKVAYFCALLCAAAAALGVDGFARRGASRRFVLATAGAAALLLGFAAAGALAPRALLAAVERPAWPKESARFAANLVQALAWSGALCAALALLLEAGRRGWLRERTRAVAAGALVFADLAGGNAFAYVLSPASVARPPSALAAYLASTPGDHRVVSPFHFDGEPPPPLRPFEWEAFRGAQGLQSGWNVDYRVGNFEPYTGMIQARATRFRSRTGYLHELPMIGIWGIDHLVVPGDPSRAAEASLPPPHVVAFSDPVLGAALVRVPHRPRAYVAREVVPVDRRGAMEFVLDPRSSPSPRTVVEAPVPAEAAAGATGMARIAVDRPEQVELAVEASAPALLVLNDSYAPGWTASVDGAPVEIVPANYLARGVWIPRGRHAVRFTYSTPWLRESWAVVLVGVLGLGLWNLRRRAAPGREVVR